ncbi:MAG: phosphoenolpyruvate--protein phosphotransferase [Desulfovibrio sp.]|jgi:phosphotransferase system enzyme I (PtsI)|nr:phosphoenolpyruvate--protein phosphotransferase [Desulfovibrio sp.]
MARVILHGFAVSSGIAMGAAVFPDRAPPAARHDQVDPADAPGEIARLRAAFAAAEAEFVEAGRRLPPDLADQAAILTSHLLICQDPKFLAESERRIREQRMNAEWALEESLAAFAGIFRRLASPYIRERIQDVRLVADRILNHLIRPEAASRIPCPAGSIFLARDISPADARNLIPRRFLALVTEEGSRTAHSGILARNLRLPAIVGVRGLSEEVRNGEDLIVDALQGKVLLSPGRDETAAYAEKKALFAAHEKRIAQNALYPAETEDGQRIILSANADTADDIPVLLAAGGEGIGLVRTEYAFLAGKTLPSEEELYAEYARMVAAMAPRRVTFRTLDIGADKLSAGGEIPHEANPALGLRAIRYCLRRPDLFRRQVKAILRAGAHGNAALMLPLISGLPEFKRAKALLNEARQELEAANIPFDPHIPVGIMIELPSAVFTADILAGEADFFSIGTNDLIQYCLGIDRANSLVAHMQQPLHPAVVRAVKYVADAGHKAGIPVSLCGEMGSDPYCLPILLGMAIDEISVAIPAIAGIKHLIRQSNVAECRELLYRALYAPTSHVISNIIRPLLHTRFADDISFFIAQPETYL